MAGVETLQSVGAQTQYTQSGQDAVSLELNKGIVVCGGKARRLVKVIGPSDACEKEYCLGGITAESAIEGMMWGRGGRSA